MTDMPKTLQDVLNDIVASRGGIDAFSAAQLVAARGLARVLGRLNDGDVSKASSIAVLESMLPPLPKPPVAGPAALEVTFIRPEPDHRYDSLEKQLRETQAELRAARATPAQNTAPVTPPRDNAGHPSDGGKVVPLRPKWDGQVCDPSIPSPSAGGDIRGNGSCAISTPLAERYPGIAFDRSVFDPNRS